MEVQYYSKFQEYPFEIFWQVSLDYRYNVLPYVIVGLCNLSLQPNLLHFNTF